MTDTKNPAPYPKRAEDVTANSLAQSLAVAAQRNHRAMDEAEIDKSALQAFVYQWGLVFLLREVQERARSTVADGIARALWENWEDGSGLGEWLWEWLTEYGINPEAVTAAVVIR